MLILSAFTFVGCSEVIAPSSLGGVVTNPSQKQDVKEMYNDALDTTESLENFEGSSENGDEFSEGNQISSEELVEEPTSEEITSEVVEEKPTEAITSYSVDYTIDYELKASIDGSPIIDTIEKQAYSFTYVNDNDDVFMELDLYLEYSDTLFFGDNNYEYTGSQKINMIFQDNILYLSQEISSPYFKDEMFSRKTSHRIDKKHLRKEFADYFLLMSVNAMLDPSSRENNNTLVDQLLTNETVEIIEVEDGKIKVQFDYEDGVATMVFDTTLNAFVSVSFDKSKEKDLAFDDIEDIDDDRDEPFEDIDDDYIGELPDNDLEDEIEDNFDSMEDQYKHHKISVDEYRYFINMNFSYNDSVATKLTEEEISEYEAAYDYGHHNAYGGYKDDFDYGYHGGHDNKGGNHKGDNGHKDGDRYW